MAGSAYDEVMHQQTSRNIDRRDWLKTASLGASAAMMVNMEARAEAQPSSGRIKGIVMMVSDGMSPGVFTMAEAFSHQARNRGTHWWNLWNHPSSSRGLMDTASANSLVTDSAAAASSWGGGQRVNNGSINVTADGKPIDPISLALKKAGVKVGLVTTTRVTHATPAGFAASVRNRGMEDEIARQYLGHADVILGGGSQKFDRDLLQAFENGGYALLRDRNELVGCRARKLLGLFGPDHLPYSVDREHDEALKAKVPTLAEMTVAGLDRFLANDERFFLMVEGGRVDHAAHLNCIAGLLHDQLAFDDAVGAVLAKVINRRDVLVIVTSDHGNSNPGLNGVGSNYSDSTKRFGKISKITMSHERMQQTWQRNKHGSAQELCGLIEKHLQFKPTDAELSAIHESFRTGKSEDWNHLHRNWEGLLGQVCGNHTGVGWTGNSHTNDPTLVSAIGPEAGRFSGMVINTDVNRHLRELLPG